jgi:hypothetical protein
MADKTTLAESSQALFCAMADFIGASKVDKIFNEKEYKNYEIFKGNWNKLFPTAKIETSFKSHVDANTDLKTIEKFLNENNDWYVSSVLIAKKLIKDIDDISGKFNAIKRPSWSSIFYVRGDKEIMKNIELLFKSAQQDQKKLNSTEGAKKHVVFGDINKWSPADIYFASPKAKQKIKKMVVDDKGLTFLILNASIGKMISDGDLLPLSLKKQTDQVNIYKVNFDRTTELEEILKLSFYGMSAWKPRTKTNPKQARNLEIYTTANKKEYIQMLHVTESSGGWKANFMLKGSEARHGSLGSQHIFADIISIIDPSFGSRWLGSFTKSNDVFKKKLKALGPKPVKVTKTKGAPKVEDTWRDSREEFSSDVTNDIMPMLITWFKNKKKAERFIQLSYQYVTSRSNDSSPFVIAK